MAANHAYGRKVSDQVRKMIAAIRHRCKRLIRVAIEDLSLDDLDAGAVKELDEAQFFRLLKL